MIIMINIIALIYSVYKASIINSFNENCDCTLISNVGSPCSKYVPETS